MSVAMVASVSALIHIQVSAMTVEEGIHDPDGRSQRLLKNRPGAGKRQAARAPTRVQTAPTRSRLAPTRVSALAPTSVRRVAPTSVRGLAPTRNPLRGRHPHPVATNKGAFAPRTRR